jgi:serine phosphatase RsbU (regulator of sigma subunit)
MLKPRDIVSGDFYWYSGYASAKLHKEKPRKNFMKLHNIPSDDSGFIIAAVDCTGHGVPGAFMSMIGFNLLETITRNGNVTPNEILFEMHLMVRYMLKQNNSDNTDGMDMSICCIKDDGKRLLYAGAKNPLYLVTKGELTVIKPDPMPIGGPQKENLREFTLHDIDINEPTSCYIFTDGYIDQFGGNPTKKFSSASLRQLLLELAHLPMQQQKMALEANLAKWRGNYRQIDDILVMGFKIGTNDIEI